MKRLMMTGLLMAMLMTTTQVFAEDVFATKNGKRFHKEGCELMKTKNVTKLERNEAAKKGLTPCKKCFSDKVALEKKEETKKIK